MMITLLSAYGVFSPAGLTKTVFGVFDKPYTMHLAVGVRLVLGAALILAAPESRFPIGFLVLGWAAIVAAVLIAIAGKERIKKVMEWGTRQPPLAMRAWCLLGVAFGAFLFAGVM